jgi:carbamoyl-phosphate synthase large subunit
VKCESIFKISEGRPNPSDYLKNGEVTMMMITSSGDEPDLRDGKDLRRLALTLQVGGGVDGVLLRMSLVYVISP